MPAEARAGNWIFSKPGCAALGLRLLRHHLAKPTLGALAGACARASIAPDADRSLHAAALAHQAVLVELAAIDAAVTAVQPAGIIGDAGLAPARNAAAGLEQFYFHGCSICSDWQVCRP
jgi:alkylhydroperoxidase family enzyme